MLHGGTGTCDGLNLFVWIHPSTSAMLVLVVELRNTYLLGGGVGKNISNLVKANEQKKLYTFIR